MGEASHVRNMLQAKLNLIGENTSPLFRIMWVWDVSTPNRRVFESNICAFHIGKGYFLSVAHVLRNDSKIVRTFHDADYLHNVEPVLTPDEKVVFDRCYALDAASNRRRATFLNDNDVATVVAAFRRVNFETRPLGFVRGICDPHLVIQFTSDSFYDNPAANGFFDASTRFSEPALNRNTFLLRVELLEAFWAEDIALFGIVNAPAELVESIPSVELDFEVYDSDVNLYCLQGGPSGTNLGRLLNKAVIDGHIDHHSGMADPVEGNSLFEGLRYLIKGYFRFGSSGAPYLVYHDDMGNFKVNAIQSEASGIQFTLNHSRDGNEQYVNGIASPLKNVEDRLRPYLV